MPEPLTVAPTILIEGDCLLLEAPGGFCLTISIAAALETSDLLLKAACEAEGRRFIQPPLRPA